MRTRAFVVAAAAVAAMAASPSAASAACANAAVVPAAANLDAVAAATVCMLNEQRAAHSLAPLTENGQLTEASLAHSRDMVARRFFAHDTPSGATIVSRLRTIGYVSDALEAWVVGENVAWGQGTLSTPARTVENWMNSQHHRDNILDRDFEEIGIGVVTGVPVATTTTLAGATYTTNFGSRTSASAAADSTATAVTGKPAAKKTTQSRKRKCRTRKQRRTRYCRSQAARKRAAAKRAQRSRR
jgi:uncharacterized protein YkwD